MKTSPPQHPLRVELFAALGLAVCANVQSAETPTLKAAYPPMVNPCLPE